MATFLFTIRHKHVDGNSDFDDNVNDNDDD